MTDDSATVLVRVRDRALRLTLNRPRAINALDLDMISRLAAALERGRDDDAVDVVVLDGAGDRGLCAGGDVRSLYDWIVDGRPHETATFFRAEYALNAAIAEYPKPIVALADGITMGGGIGLAGHAAVRIVTERSKLAMPETRIGFTPDVGGTWLLGRAPGRIGEYLGVTGGTMDAASAVYAGFADRVLPAASLPDLDPRSLVRGTDELSAETGALSAGTPSALEAARPWIDDAFAADTIPEITERLHRRPEPEAQAAASVMTELAPLGMAVTLEAVRRARALPDLRAALQQEYGLVLWFAATQPDLAEGIRAQLVDKDRNPRWNPATPAEVSPEVVASAFAYTPSEPLWQ